MNIGTQFNYNNHVPIVSTYTRIGTLHEQALIASTYSTSQEKQRFLQLEASGYTSSWRAHIESTGGIITLNLNAQSESALNYLLHSQTTVVLSMDMDGPGRAHSQNETEMIPNSMYVHTVRHITCNLVLMANPLEHCLLSPSYGILL